MPVTAAYLTIYWLYFVRGAGWPASTGASRRAAARANSIDEEAWGVALLAGMLGLVSILLLQGVMSRVVILPSQLDLDPSQFPLLSVVLWVVMGALVAGIVEETAFRGYLQRPIEQRHGPLVAILMTGVLGCHRCVPGSHGAYHLGLRRTLTGHAQSAHPENRGAR